MRQERDREPEAPGGPGVPPRRRLQTFKSLGNPDYRLFWIGNIFNNIGMWLQMVTLGFLVWELTKDPETGQGSAILSGTIGGLRFLPTLLVGPWAGVLADRMDRRKLVIVTQTFMAACAASFALLILWLGVEGPGKLEVWHAYLYASIMAVAHGLLQPARQALIANTVPQEDLANAFALNSMTVTSARLLGGVLGGSLIGALGFKYNFFVEAGLLAAMVALMVPMRIRYTEPQTARTSSPLRNLRDGISYVWNENRVIFHLILMNFVLVFAFRPVQTLLPAYTGGVLGLDDGAREGGFLLAAQGVGGMMGALMLASIGYSLKKGQVSLVALIIGSASMVVFGQSHWLLLSLGMMATMGLCQTSFITSNLTLVQTMSPDRLRGRVTSIYMLENGFGPLAILLISIFIEVAGAGYAFSSVAAACLVIAIYFQLFFSQVRSLK